jgi:hypothetical protein
MVAPNVQHFYSEIQKFRVFVAQVADVSNGILNRFIQLLDFLSEMNEVIIRRFVQYPIRPSPIEFQIAFANDAFGLFLYFEHTDPLPMKFDKGHRVHPFAFLVQTVGLGYQVFQFQ